MKEAEWGSMGQVDLAHTYCFEVEGSIAIHFSFKGEHLHMEVENMLPNPIEIKFDWYNITEPDKAKIWKVGRETTESITVPNQRRITIFWRNAE